MTLFAAIDVGSNTLRLLIAGTEGDRIIDIFSGRKITRLGAGVDRTGMLREENMETSLMALREFASLISQYGVKHMKAFATSALRESSNSGIFIEKVLKDTGIMIEVISGGKEAELTLKGALFSFPDSAFSPAADESHSALIVDIGGGSTEWILYKDNRTVDMGSMPVGVIKLAGNCIKNDPVSDDDISALHREISVHVNSLIRRIGKYSDRHTQFIGTAGTFSTIASIDLALETYSREKIHLHTLSLAGLRKMNKKLLSLTMEQRKNISGLEPERSDLIIPGLNFTINIMERFEFPELIVSEYGILEGAILDLEESGEKNISET